MTTAPAQENIVFKPDTEHGTGTPAPLDGFWLIAVRGLWVVLAIGIVAVFALSITSRYDQLMGLARTLSASLQQLTISPHGFAIYISFLDTVTLGACLAIAIVIFTRKSHDWITIFVSSMLLLFGLVVVRPADAILTADPLVRRMIDVVRFLGTGAVIIFMFVFPDGRFVPRWSAVVSGLLSLWVLGWIVAPDTLINMDNWLPLARLAVLIGLLLTGIIAQVYRYEETSSQSQKRQTKWVVLGLSLAFAGFVIFQTPLLTIPAVMSPGLPRLIYIGLGVPFFYASMLLLPITIAFSITRYRLWDIDFLINRSLIYGSLTIGLGIVFLISVFVLQQAFQMITGGQQSPLALAVGTLIIGALFQPTRTALRRFVDRRLYGINLHYRTPQPGSDLWEGPGGELIGTALGAYVVETHLGRGGMADVYKGRHVTMHRTVALKILPAIFAKEADFRRRFLREAETISKLNHPNIVQIYDYGEENDIYYMVMEYIDGPDLADVIRLRAPMRFAEAKLILSQIASALDYAHDQGVIHRDIKPSNIMLHETSGRGTAVPGVTTERAVLTDFGIAKMLGGSTRITGTGLIGTFDYMAPEQIKDSGEVDARTDVYALGVVAFHMLTGRLPFPASHPGAVLIAHLQQPAPYLLTLRSELSEDMADAVLRALEKDPSHRFSSAGAFIAAMG